MIKLYDINEINNQNETWQWCKSSDVEKLEQERLSQDLLLKETIKSANELQERYDNLEQLNAKMLEVLKIGYSNSDDTYWDFVAKPIIEKAERMK